MPCHGALAIGTAFPTGPECALLLNAVTGVTTQPSIASATYGNSFFIISSLHRTGPRGSAIAAEQNRRGAKPW